MLYKPTPAEAGNLTLYDSARHFADGANSLNDAKYAYNNLAAYYTTWYHRIGPSWHSDTEFWYQYMRDTPNMYWFNGTDPATGMQYAPTSPKLAPADYGFTVERVYEAVDDPRDVRRDADGAWHIKAGAKVRVRLTLVAPTRRYHVALVDPLPAGLEALNPALAVTGHLPEDQKAQPVKLAWWWWVRPWFEHQNLRDDRVEAFTSLLWDGVYNYSYVARATTPGSFVVPPPKAEEMYHPETFGRGAGDRVVVE